MPTLLETVTADLLCRFAIQLCWIACVPDFDLHAHSSVVLHYEHMHIINSQASGIARSIVFRIVLHILPDRYVLMAIARNTLRCGES